MNTNDASAADLAALRTVLFSACGRRGLPAPCRSG